MAKLSQRQWDNIKKRLLAGQSAYAITKDYPVTQQAISKKFSCVVNRIKDVENQIVETETNFQKLCKNEQISCVTLASEMLSISDHLATGAKLSSMTFSRLSKLAYTMAAGLNEKAINLDTVDKIGRVQRTANDAAKLPVELIKINQVQPEKLNDDPFADMTDDDIRRELAKLEYVK